MSVAALFNSVEGPYCDQDIVTDFLGPGAIGILLSMIFFGFSLSEGAMYFSSSRYQNDTCRLKIFVYLVTLLALLETGIHFWLFYNTGTNVNRSFEGILTGTFLDNFTSIPVGLEGALVQSYLALRASSLFKKKLSKYLFLFLSGLPIVCGWLGATMYAIVSFMDTAGYIEKVLPFTYPNTLAMWLLGAALADIFVTISLIVSLRSRMKGFRASTDKMLKQLMYLALESASYTAIFAFIPAILVLVVDPNSPAVAIYSAFPAPLSSLYVLSLYRNLTARDKIRQVGAQSTLISSSQFTTSPTSSNFRRSSKVNSKATMLPSNSTNSSDPSKSRMGKPLFISYELEENRYEEEGDEKDKNLMTKLVTRFTAN